jgi:pimeloyl-ACP methyl ester carboxylesterase
MSSSPTGLPTPEGPGSVSGAPNLPAGFTDTFTSRYIETGAIGLRQHAVIGGDGPPLLLVHGWPQTWYAWRLVMPALAQEFEVIAPDQRGIGLTDKPKDGYDPGTIADDLVALMDALGHQLFAVVGTDTGLPISYALAADHPDRVERVVLAEVPGPPGAVPSPPFFCPEPLNNGLWHIAVNRLDEVNEQLVRGREDIYFGYEFNIQAGTNKLPDELIGYYVELLRNPDSLHGTFAFYREWDAMMAQNEQRAKQPLTMPVLAISGADSWGEVVGEAFKPLANDVQTAVIPGAGHWFAEQAPEETLETLIPFLAPYRDGEGAAQYDRTHAGTASSPRR